MLVFSPMMMSSFFMIVELVDYLILFKKAMFSECVNKDGFYASPKPASSTFGLNTPLGQALGQVGHSSLKSSWNSRPSRVSAT